MKFSTSTIVKPIINASNYVTGTLGSIKNTVMDRVRSIKDKFISKPTLGRIEEGARINIMETPRYNQMTVEQNFVYYKNAVVRELIADLKRELKDAGLNLVSVGNHVVLLAIFLYSNKYIFDILSFAYINNVNAIMLLKFHVYTHIGSLKILLSGVITKIISKLVFNKYISLAQFLNFTFGSAIAIFTCTTIHGSYNSTIEGCLAISRVFNNIKRASSQFIRCCYTLVSLVL